MRWSSRAFKYLGTSLVWDIASQGGESASDILFIAEMTYLAIELQDDFSQSERIISAASAGYLTRQARDKSRERHGSSRTNKIMQSVETKALTSLLAPQHETYL